MSSSRLHTIATLFMAILLVLSTTSCITLLGTPTRGAETPVLPAHSSSDSDVFTIEASLGLGSEGFLKVIPISDMVPIQLFAQTHLAYESAPGAEAGWYGGASLGTWYGRVWVSPNEELGEPFTEAYGAGGSVWLLYGLAEGGRGKTSLGARILYGWEGGANLAHRKDLEAGSTEEATFVNLRPSPHTLGLVLIPLDQTFAFGSSAVVRMTSEIMYDSQDFRRNLDLFADSSPEEPSLGLFIIPTSIATSFSLKPGEDWYLTAKVGGTLTPLGSGFFLSLGAGIEL